MLCIPLNPLLSDHLGFRILGGIKWQLIQRAVGAHVVVAGLPYFLNFCSSLFICINFLLPQSSLMPTDSVLAAVATVPLTRRSPVENEIWIFPTYAGVFIPMSKHFWLWYPNCIVKMEFKLWSQVQDVLDYVEIYWCFFQDNARPWSAPLHVSSEEVMPTSACWSQ